MKNAVLVLALLPLATPVNSAEPHLNGMAEALIASEWADPTTVDDYLFNSLAFDAPLVQTSFPLDLIPLAEVQSTFGGTTASEEIFEGTMVTWLCYDTPLGRTTFVALRTEPEGNETIPAGPVLGLVVEELSPRANPACAASAPAAAPQPGNDVPRLGATRAQLEARYGSAPVDAGGHLAYVSQAELGDEDSWIESKTVYYRLESDIVTGVAYKLTTEY